MEWCQDCWLPVYNANSEAASNPHFPWCECPTLKPDTPVEERD